MTADPAPLPVPLPQWPAPDLRTLLAVVEMDAALDTEVAVDAAHAVVTDLADRASGRGWQSAYASALDAEGVSHDLPAVLADQRLAARVHERLLAWLRDPPEPEPDTPEEFGWYA